MGRAVGPHVRTAAYRSWVRGVGVGRGEGVGGKMVRGRGRAGCREGRRGEESF